MLFGTQRINAQGHLEIGGCDAVELAREFGTPLYVLDEDALREACRAYKQSFSQRLEAVEICYAGKALLTTAICRVVEQEGLGLDVASAGELYTALQAGFPTARIKMHGNFKSDLEIRMALESGVGRIVIDSISEIDRLARAAGDLGRQAEVLIRVTPGIKVQTHSYIATGHLDTKFGLSMASSVAMDAVQRCLQSPQISLKGIHCHIGSQIFGLDSFARATELMVEFMAKVRDVHQVELAELDMGGGLGIAYTSEDTPPTTEEFAEVIADALLALSLIHI
ncbi:MAG: diaminopimelate decarboxylase, partial [Armatimonadetes bacterium]|nr:diaminopimelate decarboxylase [Armatimonadota bacterium]